MANNTIYVIITPVRDEAYYIENTIASVIQQTILPSEWIIVDDGSTDGTPEILDRYRDQVEWIKVVHRKNRGFRSAGGGVMEAFYDGHASSGVSNWEFLVKLDGDLSFEPNYFERCIFRFHAEPNLGIGGGMICYKDNDQFKEESMGDPPFHVRGATKIYRRECWDQISPIVKAPGWDTIDEVKANMIGWTTRTFRDIKLVQHRATGTAYGGWRNWFKNGRGCYITGYHPVFMLGKCFKRALRKPVFLQSFALWLGFCSGYIQALAQVQDSAAIRYLRRQQIRHILKLPSIYS